MHLLIRRCILFISIKNEKCNTPATLRAVNNYPKIFFVAILYYCPYLCCIKFNFILIMANPIIQHGEGKVLYMLTEEQLKMFGLSIAEHTVQLISNKAASEKPKEKLISAKEVSEKYHLSLQTLWRWAKVGRLVPTKVGSRNLYKESEVIRIIGL